MDGLAKKTAETPSLVDVPEGHPMVSAGVFSREDCKMLSKTLTARCKLIWGLHITVTVREGYITNGASVPRHLPERAFGTPWDMPRLVAAIVHDALYSIKWRFRWLADRVYRNMCVEYGIERAVADFEYACIRAAGWKAWNGVKKVERNWAKPLVSVYID